MNIVIKGNIKLDEIGILTILNFCEQVNHCVDDRIMVNFQNLNFLEANLCAILGATFRKLALEGKLIELYQFQWKVERVLIKNNFLHFFNNKLPFNSEFTNIIKYREFKLGDHFEFKNYLSDGILSHPNLPSMSKQAKKTLQVAFLEVFANCNRHSKSNVVVACGQFYPKINKIHFTIVDIGVGFYTNVSEFLNNKEMSHKEAICWAVEKGKSTRPENEMGGLGLHVIREFLSLNEGFLQIVSGFGYWKEEKNVIFASNLPNKFSGTIINLSLNLNDLKHYFVKGEEFEVPEVVF